MNWLKHGVVWQPSGSKWWARSHATCPTPIWLSDRRLRVYVQCRDDKNVGRVGYVDLDPSDPRHVVAESAEPVLDVGRAGAFDDNGVFQTSVIQLPDGRLYMYYVGFELCHHIRYRLLTGLAVSDDNGETFHRVQSTPILERSPGEEHVRGGAWVIHASERFHMWYVAGGSWETINGKSMPIYDIRYVESADGREWPELGRTVLPINHLQEHGFGRPVVRIEDSGDFRMFYSVRRRYPVNYRMGYARSQDGLEWRREDDEIGIDVSDTGWDSESIEYGVDVRAAGKTWLLYNGNDFGGSGFGIAERIGAE